MTFSQEGAYAGTPYDQVPTCDTPSAPTSALPVPVLTHFRAVQAYLTHLMKTDEEDLSKRGSDRIDAKEWSEAQRVAEAAYQRALLAISHEGEIVGRLSRAEQQYREERRSQDEEIRDMAPIDVGDVYEGAVSELLHLVATWKRTEDEIDYCPLIGAAARQVGVPYSLAHICLEQRARVLRQASRIMGRFLKVERERQVSLLFIAKGGDTVEEDGQLAGAEHLEARR